MSPEQKNIMNTVLSRIRGYSSSTSFFDPIRWDWHVVTHKAFLSLEEGKIFLGICIDNALEQGLVHTTVYRVDIYALNAEEWACM
eukprot:3738469-Rhodomonas_salina.1